VKFLRTQHDRHTTRCPHGTAWQGHCAHTVACAYGRTYSGWDAYRGWEQTVEKHRRDGRQMSNPPRGALLFFKGGSYGHVCVSNGRRKAWTNDAPTTGRIGLVPITWFAAHWQSRYVGWVWADEVAGW
jgi:hypothetical protein